MTTLRVLGTLDLRGPDGRPLVSPLAGSKRLGLLVYLTLGARPGLMRRDTLLALFWPELDEKSARNSLSNMLHQIRRSLGRDVIVSRGHDVVGLADGAVWCDAIAFQDALDARRPREALELYRGELLEGFFVRGASVEFDHWLDSERARLRRRASDIARTLTERAARDGSPGDAVHWARRAAAIDRYDEGAVRRLITLLGETDDRAGALRAYEDLAARLARDFESAPSLETQKAVERIRGESDPGGTAFPSQRMEPDRAFGMGTGAEDRSDFLPPRSVAVLPFKNLMGAADVEPLVEGLHDDLLTELSRYSALSVIARTSVQRYRDTTMPVQEIARQLGAAIIVEGGVQIDGRRVRLNVQAIDALSGAHRWAERYDRTLSPDHLFELQSELAGKIAWALRAKLTPAERGRAGRQKTTSLDAFRLYAQGRGFLDQRIEGAVRRSLGYFERAVELDPEYALAWVGLSDALSLLHDYGYEEADRVLPRADEAVQRALDLDPMLAEAYASRGLLHSTRREGASALRELRRSIGLRPGYAEAHNWLSWNLLVLGYPGEALESARRAAELDPMSPEAVVNVSLSHIVNGNAEPAIRAARRVRELQPNWTTGHFYEALALYHVGRFTEAIPVLRGLTAEWAGSGPKATLALALAVAGEEAEARELATEFESAGDWFATGVARLALGERERAFQAFEAVDQWDYWSTLSMHHFYPEVLAPLRADPLYQRMRKEMNRSWGREPADP